MNIDNVKECAGCEDSENAPHAPDCESKPYFQRYENLDTHWFACKVCGGVSWDSDTAALAGKIDLSDKDVTHVEHCPGEAFPDKHIRRITRR